MNSYEKIYELLTETGSAESGAKNKPVKKGLIRRAIQGAKTKKGWKKAGRVAGKALVDYEKSRAALKKDDPMGLLGND